ncbi:uncharacterized protein [Chanodichthys erythropterus]|uniref:uncharacterized protein isoform X1 n=1 Tax=Chanodichthys erythropterus TaxID=933992 RepID=UPI00351E561E
MDMSASDEECPVCRETITNPSQPSPCCRKVICQRCLSQSLRFRTHCPYCRSSDYANNPFVVQPPSRRRHLRPILPGNFDTFNSRRPVGSSIRNLISQLQDSQAQQTGTAAQVSLPNQAAPAPAPQIQAPPLFMPSARPVPMPRTRVQPANLMTTMQPANLNAAPAGPIQVAQTPAPAPLLPNSTPLLPNYTPLLPNSTPLLPNPTPTLLNPAPWLLNPAPPQEDLQAALDEWPWQTEITVMEMNPQPQSLTVRTFVCPYCQDDGLDELDLRDHCNNHHANDFRHVVCPVCVAAPHGDPQYYSRDFIGHLNLRHCYYMDDITNLHQSDEMNLQCAILASYRQNI